ncbi:MAG: hypothetical protein LBF09_07730 [Odoribacteraceae bacterium]|jgi:uncharacterized iron-regulated protein|nr:hypothetical protein [Odoribacteraceae bacterium]
MKQFTFWISCLSIILASTACEDNNNTNEEQNAELYRGILEQYVNTTIIPTYRSLATAALEMRAANEKLKNTPTNENMQAASDAWMNARVWWELSEAFLFGPVGENALDIDGHIDSWPLELEDIQSELASGTGLTGQEAWQKDAEVIGFHVTEYLLYRDGQSRPVADLSTAELNYLTAATDALVWDCVLAYVAWVGEENVTDEMKIVFRENPDVVAHLDNNSYYKNFARKLTTADGYSSWADALSEIAVGAAEIAGEVGTTKIEAPYVAGNVMEVESWYSWHSIDDYRNNIKSIKNAYLGGVNDNTRQTVTLSSLVRQIDADLDSRVKAKIEECLEKIAAIGTGGKSFYEVVRDQVNSEQVGAAVDACNELQQLFDALPEIL